MSIAERPVISPFKAEQMGLALNNAGTGNSVADVRKTKIVCTIGPACNTPEKVRQLIQTGCSVFRFNFSHGTHEQHSQALEIVRREARDLELPVAVMQDLCGPKIRISHIAAGEVDAKEGMMLKVTTNGRIGNDPTCRHFEWDLSSTYEPLLDDIRPGDHLLINDGRVELVVDRVFPNYLNSTVIRAGKITKGKGLNMPGVALSTPSITEKDWKDVAWAVANNIDFVALSFVREAVDILRLREYLAGHDCRAHIIAKIERPEALDHIHEIIKEADGIMVARGDLGLETDFAEVPLIQKKLIELCRLQAKPVITATQMLDSMVTAPTPTRAEVSDVANAILDGSDAIMLSNETAAGEYPVRSVEVLDRIALASEKAYPRFSRSMGADDHSDKVVVTEAAATMATHAQAKRIVVYTGSGHTARLISRYRLPIPVVVVTNHAKTCQQLALSYGCQPIYLPEISKLSQLLEKMDELALEKHWASPGDNLVVISALDGRDGRIDTLHVHHVKAKS